MRLTSAPYAPVDSLEVHENDVDDYENATRGTSRGLNRAERVPDAPAKRTRQISDSENAGPRALAEEISPAKNTSSNPQEATHEQPPNTESLLFEFAASPLAPNVQNVPDWDLHCPFYGEGLQPDVNLDWTLDFLSNGISTHSPLDSINGREGMMAPTALANSEPTQDRRHDQLQRGADFTQQESQEWLDQGHEHVSPEAQGPACESLGRTAYVEIHERDVFIGKSATLLMKRQLSENSYKSMVETVTAPLLDEICSEKGKRPHSFPAISTIVYFLGLFFVHVQPRFPVLHVPTFDPNECSPNLLLAMAISGSSYSESNQGKFTSAYLKRVRMAIRLMQERDQSYVRLLRSSYCLDTDCFIPFQLRSSSNLFALFLVSLSAMWVGQKAAYERAEGDRGDLAVYCRRAQLLDCRPKHMRASQSPLRSNRNRLEEQWKEWINDEQKKRLGLCIYLLDCQVVAVYQRQPYIGKAETVNSALPCSETFWSAPTAWAWKSLLGPADIPPSIYYLTTLTSILLYNEIPDVLPFPPLDNFCKTLYAYVLHSHVFEWRQTICMLNPTGLLTSPLSLAPQNIGNSLLERREWLEACLRNWDTFYGVQNRAEPVNTSSKNSAGILLHHLAVLALHLNFSDLHVVAGRAGSDADIILAEQSLQNWLQEEKAQKIFDYNSLMLNAAHDAIAAGDAQRSGFELAICLFIGGLTSWAMFRFASFDPTLTGFPNQKYGSSDSRNRHPEDTVYLPEETAKNSLMAQVADACNGLRVLKCLRLALVFGNTLERLLSEPVR
ncbi:hypothetical protein N7466_005406 [Penicillium verhagenii]|uniref:uncharacterized protein n=1 Tax=Penicillium verhagenii TaxID=1562060 RepID=UPI002545649C|nr:uncharacterized protein N7466_005406 [Penicillium verhagenii]KAJ5929913.1 hypothetical protein N7466_005406 [Penicillium verhagenii]